MEITIPISIKLTPESQAFIDAFASIKKTATPTQTNSVLAIGSPWQGGKYAGISIGEDGQPDHSLALLSHKADKAMTWEDAKAWAASFGDGSRLPTKREAALLYANLPGEFDTSDYHWTSTPYSDSYAWVQHFRDGSQGTSLIKPSKCLCRAVR